MNGYDLVKLGKEKQGISSDNAFAIRFGLSRQNIYDWKIGKSMPNWKHLPVLAEAAGMTLGEAVAFMESQSKQAGFISMAMMAILALGSFGLMSLLKVSPTLLTAYSADIIALMTPFIHYAK